MLEQVLNDLAVGRLPLWKFPTSVKDMIENGREIEGCIDMIRQQQLEAGEIGVAEGFR